MWWMKGDSDDPAQLSLRILSYRSAASQEARDGGPHPPGEMVHLRECAGLGLPELRPSLFRCGGGLGYGSQYEIYPRRCPSRRGLRHSAARFGSLNAPQTIPVTIDLRQIEG